MSEVLSVVREAPRQVAEQSALSRRLAEDRNGAADAASRACAETRGLLDGAPRPLRVALADDDPDVREQLRLLVGAMGHEAVAVADGRQLVELCGASPPDLAIADVRMPCLAGPAAALALGVPVILVSAHAPPGEALADNIMAFLVKPVSEAQLKAAIPLAVRLYGQLKSLRDEGASLRQALEDRKVIERAKGALMRRLRVDEEEAFRRLRLLASSHNRKLIDVAREVLEAEGVFRALEGESTGRLG